MIEDWSDDVGILKIITSLTKIFQPREFTRHALNISNKLQIESVTKRENLRT